LTQSWSIDVATHDYEIANQTPANFRADLNNALQAIVTQNSGSSAPTTTFANMLWYDTANNQLKKRNEADTAWITLFTIDDSNGNLTFAAPSVTNSITVNTSNTTGQGIVLSDDGDIVDLNTGYAAMRFSNGVQIYSANKGGSPVITLGSNGVIESTTRETVTKTSGSAAYYGARAWVRVAGNSVVGAVNISSYNTSNDYVYFTTAAPNANYAVAVTGITRGGTYADDIQAGYFRVQMWSSGGNFVDPSNFQAIVCW
jgi:hypothetical protein